MHELNAPEAALTARVQHLETPWFDSNALETNRRFAGDDLKVPVRDLNTRETHVK